LLLNKQQLNNRKLLLSRINYHRRSEFTEKISHRRFECMLSCLPSVTSVGMASLLPHKEMQVDGSLNVTVGVSFLLALLFRTCGVLLCIHYIFLRTDCIILKNIACS